MLTPPLKIPLKTLLGISFNIPTYTGKELRYIKRALKNRKICGDGNYTLKCHKWFEKTTGTQKALLTTSCTHALEMAALLCNIQKGDEVIMPSYTFVSTANAFVQRGAKIKFVDIRPDTMNIDESLIESAITTATKAIVPVHYAGVSCEMDKILEIAQKHDLYVVEDAAQGVMASYKEKPLGTMGDFGCYSFHETKNYSMGEGGALLINDPIFISYAEVIREKGTNRSRFMKGQTDKYTWIAYGSSYLPSDINAAHLYAQLISSRKINQNRLASWNYYLGRLFHFAAKDYIELPYIPPGCTHNAHMFYIKLKDKQIRTSLMDFLKNKGITSAFHYIPLHSSPAGLHYGTFVGKDQHTTRESEKLLRLPLFYGMTIPQIERICENIEGFLTL